MQNKLSLLLSTSLSLVLLCGLFGCAAQKQFDDPVAVMANSKLSDERLASARQSELKHADDPARIKALNKMIWNRGHSAEERQYAIDQLLAYDGPTFRKSLARRIVLIKNPYTLTYICELATEQNWRDFAPALVRSYARQMPLVEGDQRPEAKALAALYPATPINKIIFDVFANADDDARIEEQVAAWELLCEKADYQQVSTFLGEVTSANPMVLDLKASMMDLHCLPAKREGYLRLAWLRDPSRKAWWDQAKNVVSKLSESQKQGLELRHLPVLIQLDEQTKTLTRQELVDKLTIVVDKQDHYLRGPNFDGPMGDYPQRFSQAVDKLAWADLATIDLLFAQVQQPRIVASLFEQGDKDRVDIGSEHGGVISVKKGVVSAVRFPAMVRMHDYKFVPSQEMIHALYTNLSHYHFHAQRYHSRNYAGPGMGDLRMAQKLEIHCLVFTFIDENVINVDYFQPNGVVADLGVIRR